MRYWPVCLPFDRNTTLTSTLPLVCRVGLHSGSKVSDSIGFIKSILVSVSEKQISDTFNHTFFHGDIK